MGGLKARTLIVTGASRGIGRAIALELARNNASIVLNARTEEPLIEAAEECRALGVLAEPVVGDAADPRVGRAMVEAALETGGLFGFIHNAGVARPGPLLWELSDAQVREVVGASLTAGFHLIRYALPILKEKGEGVAVFLGSGAAVSNLPGLGAYAVAKAAEEHLARQLAAEAPEIVSFVYRPSVVETRMQQEARRAEGGAAHVILPVFRGYKARGLLITPGEAARRLVGILTKDHRRFHGLVVDY